jgi:hypothetical protein
MNLGQAMTAHLAPKGPKACVVCGNHCKAKTAGGWLMSIVAGAKVHGFTLKAPAASSIHDHCRERLTTMLVNKRSQKCGGKNV